MAIRRLTLYLALALLLLSPGGALAGPSACAAIDGACLSPTEDASPPEGDASTRSEAPAPLLERAAPPRHESAGPPAGQAGGTAVERPLDVDSPRPERLVGPAVTSVSQPLYLRNCSFLC